MSKVSLNPDFSLVLGGPLYQFFLRTRLAIPPLRLLKRRILVLSLLAWLPLAVLAFFEGIFFSGPKVPFLLDLGTHTRFLMAMPLLIIAELAVHEIIRPLIAEFVDREIVHKGERANFEAIIASILRLRNSYVAELIILAVVYSFGQIWMRWNTGILGDTWIRDASNGALPLTLAGYWYTYVSIPLMQFLVFRWYYRIFLWFLFLFRTSRLNLRIISTHPDRAGGLGFLEDSAIAFIPLMLAHSLFLSGTIANHIYLGGHSLLEFKYEIAVFGAILLFLVFGPLINFSPLLLRTRRLGQRSYGGLASRMVLGFDDRWIVGAKKQAEGLLDVGDVQSLADLGNSYDRVRAMKPFPFSGHVFLHLAAAFAVPLMPLILTLIPAEELLGRILKLVF